MVAYTCRYSSGQLIPIFQSIASISAEELYCVYSCIFVFAVKIEVLVMGNYGLVFADPATYNKTEVLQLFRPLSFKSSSHFKAALMCSR